MTTVAEYIESQFGERLSEWEIDYMMWNQTAWPFGWPQLIVKQINSYMRARRNGVRRCEMCGHKLEFCRCDAWMRGAV
jgi:hypothetical protein